MSVVAADLVDKAHFPALRDYFSAPIAVACNIVRAANNRKSSSFGATSDDVADNSDV